MEERKIQEDAFEKLIEEKRQVKCTACFTMHDVDSDGYLSIYGNICIGRSGGIVGNNFDDDGMLNRVMIFCRNKECFNLVVKTLGERRT